MNFKMINLIGKIFTNSQYAIRKENDCYAYKVLGYRVLNDSNLETLKEVKIEVDAVQLKLIIIKSPIDKKIDNMSELGIVELLMPIETIDNVEIFKISSFGKQQAIVNGDKFLIEFDLEKEIPQWQTYSSNMYL